MAVAYFGFTAGWDDAQPCQYTFSNDNSNIVFTCPNSGTQDVKELGAYVYANQSGHIRLALYDTSRNLICQGSAEMDVALITSHGWQTHTEFVDADGEPVSPTITGGTNYIIALAGDTSNAYIWCTGVTSGWMKRDDEYTGGYPASLPWFTTWEKKFGVRCGVEASAAGGANYVPAIYHYQRMRAA